METQARSQDASMQQLFQLFRLNELIILFERIINSFEWINNSFERIVNSFERINNSFERIDNSFERINNSFERINNSFERIIIFSKNVTLGAPYTRATGKRVYTRLPVENT